MASLEMLELKCRNCSAQLSPSDISEKLAMARCGHCDAVFALAITKETEAYRERAKVGMPPGIRSSRDERNRLVISRSWKSAVTYFLVFFATIWNGFMLVWHTISALSGAFMMNVFGLLHTAIGLGLIYKVVADFRNSTHIIVGRDQISIRHEPMKWPGEKDIPITGIKQLYCKKRIRHTKNGTSTTYTVRIIDKSNTHIDLIPGLPTAEQAIFIEQQIEEYLGIKDAEVRDSVA